MQYNTMHVAYIFNILFSVLLIIYYLSFPFKQANAIRFGIDSNVVFVATFRREMEPEKTQAHVHYETNERVRVQKELHVLLFRRTFERARGAPVVP
jgi:hypothetical protein